MLSDTVPRQYVFLFQPALVDHEFNLRVFVNAREVFSVPNEKRYYLLLRTSVGFCNTVNKYLRHDILADEFMYKDVFSVRSEVALMFGFSDVKTRLGF